MLRQYPTSALLQRTRLSITTSASQTTRSPIIMAAPDVASRPQSTHAAEHAEEYKQTKPTRPSSLLFPLGYKDAAYQWVSQTPPQALP